MPRIRNLLTLAVCLVAVLALGGIASAASSPAKQAALTPYIISAGPSVAAARGLKADASTADATRLQFDPLLRRLAQEGSVQNVRVLGEGAVSLLASSSAARALQAGGSSVLPVAPSAASDQPAAGTIAGTVSVSGGSALAGATVSAFSGTNVVTATTGVSGTYSLNIAVDGDYQVGVSAAGYDLQPAVMVKVPTGAGGVNFSLVPQNLTITGRIADTANAPLAGVQVAATDLVYDNFTAGGYTTTDATGNYTLTVSAATYEVRAFLPPFGAQSKTVVVPPAASGKDFTFNTTTTVFTVSGIARTAAGAPLPGAEVQFYANNIPFNSCDPRFANYATAGADGRYTVTLPTGSYQTYTNWPNEWADHWVVASQDVVTITNSITNLDRTLPTVATIRGTVTTPGGQPLAKARVFSWRNTPTNTWFDGFFTTDASGSYVVTATLGVHRLIAFQDNYALGAYQQVNLNGSLTGVNLQVAAGIAAGGTLTGSDGPALRWGDVTFQVGQNGARFDRHAVVYYNGAWRSTFSQGSYTFNVNQSFYDTGSRTQNVNPNPQPINFTLTRKTQRVSGTVTNTTGAGMCDAYITATRSGSTQQGYANSTGDGNYAMMVSPGSYRVSPYKFRSNSSNASNNINIVVPPAPAPINYRLTEVFFTDVLTDSTYFEPIGYLIYRNIASGYADGTYRPFNNTTRGQVSKLIVLGEGWALENPPTPTFNDVPTDNPFYMFIETAYSHGAIAGYSDGTFRWGNNVTRGQLSKIIVLAEGWAINAAGGPHFTDVPTTNPFYPFIETAYNHGIISGYSDGTFRWGNNATRGQIAKIVYNALTQP